MKRSKNDPDLLFDNLHPLGQHSDEIPPHCPVCFCQIAFHFFRKILQSPHCLLKLCQSGFFFADPLFLLL